MTVWAPRGEEQDAWPDGVGLPDRSYLIPGQRVYPWTCPTCGIVTAATMRDGETRQTAPVGYRPVPYPNGSRDGLPLYGPSVRYARGQQTRRGEKRRDAAAVEQDYRRGPKRMDILRSVFDPAAEPVTEPLGLIVERRFELICHNCYGRVGIDTTG